MYIFDKQNINSQINLSSLMYYSLSICGRVAGSRVHRDYPGDVINQFFIR
jgi:hypothetical protein